MPVPWEALIPFGLVTAMFGVTGTAFNIARRVSNDGKPPRYGLDEWDEMMMERDQRITGSLRGQKSDPTPPENFATNSTWYTKRSI
ncbi:hypothetical protein M407DRAFT_241957 [Tulasnella calospora MUT 4182]|uniref:NADH dehydrogenase [ubiquinone] 1 alpha subcomplex subunit 1 n=1 Tax=Tulasnella calospora MUT 4182 TaxID=1051891 RepID=A0A0C3QH09_9AGAM|nr:hypothetical protein M407DRAFT_241957 [Tulasnella calospora MUT 4182]